MSLVPKKQEENSSADHIDTNVKQKTMINTTKPKSNVKQCLKKDNKGYINVKSMINQL